jgi:Animal haem peroxidase
MRHGKWWDRWQQVSLENIMEGRFDRLFDPANVPAATFAEDDLRKLAAAMTADVESPPTPETLVDSEENPGIVAVYTYLGQFLDHDITFDPVSQLRQFIRNIGDVTDFRTPRLDLDCLYGRGPGDQPYLYDDAGVRLLLGDPLSGNQHDQDAKDLQRGPDGRALIGDPRNDENRIVAQLQATMIRFHNRMADLIGGDKFDEIRDQVRWHYQWVVVNDFLPTIINQSTIQKVFPSLASGRSAGDDKPQVTIGPLVPEARHHDGFLMPVEFSVAAYRFGHSMIRPIYRLNETISRRPIFSVSSDSAADLGGMRRIPDDWAIDWQFFVEIGDGAAANDDPDDPIARKPQHAYKIDTSVVGALGHLPPIVAANPSSLAERNLLRGRDFELPSGQAIAAALGEPVFDVVIGKATDEDPKIPITQVSKAFADQAPLWAYVLSEAHVSSWDAAPAGPKDNVPIKLGPVGGRIVAEVFAAILLADRTSFINAAPQFKPRPELMRNNAFGIAELIRAALGR